MHRTPQVGYFPVAWEICVRCKIWRFAIQIQRKNTKQTQIIQSLSDLFPRQWRRQVVGVWYSRGLTVSAEREKGINGSVLQAGNQLPWAIGNQFPWLFPWLAISMTGSFHEHLATLSLHKCILQRSICHNTTCYSRTESTHLQMSPAGRSFAQGYMQRSGRAVWDIIEELKWWTT